MGSDRGGRTVLVLLDDAAQAKRARDVLEAAGFDAAKITIASGWFSPPPPPPLSLPLFPQTPISLSLSAPPSTSTLPAASLEIVEKKGKRHEAAIDAFSELWAAKRGGRYRVIGGRDGKALKSLLNDSPEATLPEIKRRLAIAFDDPWFRQNGNIAIFCSRWANYDRPGDGRPTPPPMHVTAKSTGKRMTLTPDGRFVEV